MKTAKAIRDFYDNLVLELRPHYQREEAQTICRWLLEDITGLDAFKLSQAWTRAFNAPERKRFQKARQRLLSGEPIQYVLGQAHFYGRKFEVSPVVLIPRGETEELMIWARDTMIQNQSSNRHWDILDIGTGSGCIAISLQLELAQRQIATQITGVDISEPALQIAKNNTHRLQSEVRFEQMDILAAAQAHFQAQDILISNPPYIPAIEKQEMARHVTAHEPALALFVSDHDPLLFYRQIIFLAESWLRKGGYLFFEIHEEMGKAILALFHETHWDTPLIRQDIHGKERMIRGRKRS